ncbi:LD-carboxypeptidase [Nonomuraea endophytica]|uniref:LD-carboxypeptidase n=1 Tax=Nonomuraea endophytica TaxID=714136 RepID=UPI0037C54B26
MRPGDTVAVVSPSGPPDAVRLARGVALLEGLGVRVVVGANTMARQGLPYLAGSDAARAADLQAAWCDPAVTTVFCSRGGYGAARVLDLLDWNAMRAAGPKTLVGSSDVTALHHAFRVELGVATLHGPMPACTMFSDERGPEPATWASLTGALKGEPWSVAGTSMLSEALPGVASPINGPIAGPVTGPVTGPIAGPIAGPVTGPVTGPIAGGNLSVLASLCGTRWQPRFTGNIVFLEDVGEAPYRVDRMLTQLLRAGAFEGVLGFALGSWEECGDPYPVLRERLLPLGVPVLAGLAVGHGTPQLSVWLGALGAIDTESCSLAGQFSDVGTAR